MQDSSALRIEKYDEKWSANYLIQHMGFQLYRISYFCSLQLYFEEVSSSEICETLYWHNHIPTRDAIKTTILL